MESIFKKYFFLTVWVALPVILGAILDHYLKLAWILLFSIGVSVLLFFVYWYFYQRFSYLNASIDILQNKVQNIQEALGTSDEREEKLSWSLFWSKVQQLTAKIEGSNFNPDVIISFGRSGAVVGGMIASILGSIKHIGLDRVVVITKKPDYPEERNIEIDSTIVKPYFDTLNGKRILCVMSECTTGNTLHEINKLFRSIPNVKVKTAVIFSKIDVTCKPDFCVDYSDEKWPELPFRIEGKWKNYYPRVERIIPISKDK